MLDVITNKSCITLMKRKLLLKILCSEVLNKAWVTFLTKRDNFILCLFYLKELKMESIKKNMISISIKSKKSNNTINCSKSFIFITTDPSIPKQVKSFLKILSKNIKALLTIFQEMRPLLWFNQFQMIFFSISVSSRTESNTLKKLSMIQRKMQLNTI